MKKILLVFSLFFLSNCSDYLDVNPPLKLSPNQVYDNLTSLERLTMGMYDGMQSRHYYGAVMIYLPEVMSDIAQTSRPGVRTETFYNYYHNPTNTATNTFRKIYYVNNIANRVLANIDKVNAPTVADQQKRDRLKGEALAIRALTHFDALRLFAKQYMLDKNAPGIPLITSVQAPEDKPARAKVAQVYEQIEKDLKAAIDWLPLQKRSGQINRWAAKALLAKVYLYEGKNQEAFDLSEQVIKGGAYQLAPGNKYVSSFNEKDNSESLFEVVNTLDDNAGREGIGNLLNPEGYHALLVTKKLRALIALDPEDIRNQLFEADKFKSDRFIKKYPGANNGMVSQVRVLRLSEVYLIAAETAQKLGNASAAATYLNAIAQRANAKAEEIQNPGLERILEERAKELVMEGNRLWDLVRNRKDVDRNADGALTSAPLHISHTDHRVVLPIPQSEIDKNSSLVQNPGY